MGKVSRLSDLLRTPIEQPISRLINTTFFSDLGVLYLVYFLLVISMSFILWIPNLIVIIMVSFIVLMPLHSMGVDLESILESSWTNENMIILFLSLCYIVPNTVIGIYFLNKLDQLREDSMSGKELLFIATTAAVLAQCLIQYLNRDWKL